jgi:copper/silver efflux system protein
MIERIIEFSARNRFFVFLLIVFMIVWAVWAMFNIPLDAVPDLSDTQVIVFTEWTGRSPDLVEDQVTYPIVTAMLSAPNVQTVRGISDFGFSYVYIIFEDGTDIYWARSRVLEYLQGITGQLPEGAAPQLGPDASGVGWVFQYALVDETGQYNLAQLRSFQDWYMRYWLLSVPGVAEVASIGGFVKQYQVELDPNKLLAYGIPLSQAITAIQRSNNDVGGRVLEIAKTEYMVRGRGYIRSLEDIEMIPVVTDGRGTPIYIRDLGRVQFGPEMRRGLAELDGLGEVVGGIVVMRYGENALTVVDQVKQRIREVEGSLPPGVKLVTTYDRSDLILRAIDTLRQKLTEEMLIVSIIILVFLLHIRTALIPILALPIAVLLSFIPMYYMGLTANIMSLGGIAIAIGAMVDASIILIENCHKNLYSWDEAGRPGNRIEVVIKSFREVGTSIFFSLLVITVSFIPVFTLIAQEGRLFRPLAFTKTFSMLFAAFLAITLVPALGVLLIRGRIRSEESHPISRFLQGLYDPVLRFSLRYPKLLIVGSLILILTAIPAFMALGSEFMPPLNEGSLLYMPSSVPGMSITEASRILQTQDKILKQFPEVERVFGKIGRADTATDPAPLSMAETVILLKPQDEWERVHQHRWYSDWAPSFLKTPLGMVWPEERTKTWEELVAEMDARLQMPGMPNIWWMPVQTRTEMLSTGIRSNLGIKVFGPSLETIDEIGLQIEQLLQNFPGTRSVFADRVVGGYYLDFDIYREAAARYGLTVGDVMDVIESAIGGKNVTTTIEGRERYPVNVRYPRELRDDADVLRRVLVPTPTGAQVPISLLADIRHLQGPPMIRNEDGQLVGFVFVDVTDKDYGGYVSRAQQEIEANLQLPAGYRLEWTGQYKYMERMRSRLTFIIPMTLFIVFILLYVNFGSWKEALIIFLALPTSLVGAIWLLYLLDYNMSMAVWVGLIALAGLDAETGVIMLIYLRLSHQRWTEEGRLHTLEDLKGSIYEGSVKRLRPKVMTVVTTMVALMPIMWAPITATGADVMKRMAAPLVGGMLSSFFLELAVYPAIFLLWKGRQFRDRDR